MTTKLSRTYIIENGIQIGYIEKAIVGFRHHHIIKDVDIYFNKSKPYIVYKTHTETWDLLKQIIIADYREFGGTEIIINGIGYTVPDAFDTYNLIFDHSRIQAKLYCDAIVAEMDIRYVLNYENEGWDELYRQYNT